MSLLNRDIEKSERYSFALPSWLWETSLVLGLVVGLVGVMTVHLGAKAKLVRESRKPTMIAKKVRHRAHRKTQLASVAPIPETIPLELPVEEPQDLPGNLKIEYSQIPSFTGIEQQVRASSSNADASN